MEGTLIESGASCTASCQAGGNTLPETNIALETLGLEDEFPFGKASLLGGAMLILGSVIFPYISGEGAGSWW